MANVAFTRDEVILTLDVLYNSGEKITANSKAIFDLSNTLNSLPIHAESNMPANFRNPAGLYNQIMRFCSGYSEKSKTWNVGTLFFKVDKEFSGRHDELHYVAEAIKRNQSYYEEAKFGNPAECDDFPEGALLGHLHRVIEQRDGAKLNASNRCEICQLKPEQIYKSCGTLLKNHLLVQPTAMDAQQTYSVGNFITVCPCCHAVLHKRRPWVNRANMEDILR